MLALSLTGLGPGQWIPPLWVWPFVAFVLHRIRRNLRVLSGTPDRRKRWE